MARQLVWVSVWLSLASCAARGPAPQLVAELGTAVALVNAGCFTCLTEAIDIYDRIARAERAPAEAHRRAFEAAVLLAVRFKELGLPDAAPLARARELAARVPPSTTLQLSPSAYLDAVDLIAGEGSGLDPEARELRTRDRRTRYGPNVTEHPARLALTPALPSDALATYLAVAIDCDDARARKAIDVEQTLARYGTTLMRFRFALCALGTDTFQSLREGDARWQDTLFFEGRREMTRQPIADVGRAAVLFTNARAAFPASPAITLSLALARNALSEYEAALALYDTLLAETPTHRDALLGRVMSLSYLNRHPAAIAAASQLIALGTWHQGDAFYWRAWNRYHLTQLDAAWDDIERASRLSVNSAVYMLAGIIAYARQQLDTAIARLDQSFALDRTNCEAVWTEALVHTEKQVWTLAAARFSSGVTCFTAAATQASRDIAATERADVTEAVKLRRLAAAQKRLQTAEHRTAQAAYNAAASYLRLGQKHDALSNVDVAALHPLLKDKAAGLKVLIEKLPSP